MGGVWVSVWVRVRHKLYVPSPLPSNLPPFQGGTGRGVSEEIYHPSLTLLFQRHRMQHQSPSSAQHRIAPRLTHAPYPPRGGLGPGGSCAGGSHTSVHTKPLVLPPQSYVGGDVEGKESARDWGENGYIPSYIYTYVLAPAMQLGVFGELHELSEHALCHA